MVYSALKSILSKISVDLHESMIEKSIDYIVISKVYRFVTVSLRLVVNILSIFFCR